MKPLIKYYLHLFIYLQFAFIYANAGDKGLITFNNQYIYVSPNTLLYSELQVVEMEILQDNICSSVFVFLPKNTLKTKESTAKIFNKTSELKLQHAIKLKNKSKQTFIHSNNSSNSLSILRTSNKLCVVPISNTDFKFNSKETNVVLVTQPIKNIQKQNKYKNPTLGLFLQNTTPVYNKPPPFI